MAKGDLKIGNGEVLLRVSSVCSKSLERFSGFVEVNNTVKSFV